MVHQSPGPAKIKFFRSFFTVLLIASSTSWANKFSLGIFGSHVHEYNFNATAEWVTDLKLKDNFNGGLMLRLPVSKSWRLSFLAAAGAASNASISIVYQTRPLKKPSSRAANFGDAVLTVMTYAFAILRSRFLFGFTTTGFLRQQEEIGWGAGLTYGLRTKEWAKFYFIFRHSFLFLNDAFIINRGDRLRVGYSIIAQIQLGLARRF